jgi:TolB-like protein/Tfp pilus assembly protein PilF/DNA-binding winged helix-turn-helix (wHTH) protein
VNVTDLQAGFRLDDWFVEPRQRRITGTGGSHSLTDEQVEILLALAEHHGEAIDLDSLRARVWPDGAGDESALRERVRGLQEVLGDVPEAPRLILPAGGHGYALVAHFEPAAGRAPHWPADPPTEELHPRGLAPRATARMLRLIEELRRRHVLKVSVGYLVAVWLILQVAETTFEPLHLPQWWMTALTILAVIGIPVVTVLAWLYDITPAGIVADSSGSRISLPRRRRSLAPWIVTGVAVMAAVTGFAWWRTIPQAPDVSSGGPAFASVAVLPMLDMSPAGSDDAYLGDGLSEELSSQLAQVHGLRVAARTSAFSFRGRNADVREIARTLGVRHVLEGSVRRQGARVRVTAQLIDAKSGFHTWSESYDRPADDLLSIQQDVAEAITEQLKVVLTKDEKRRLRRPTTQSPRAYDLYLTGLGQLRKAGGLSQVLEAENLFQRALQIDPGFARAHAGLCETAIVRYGRTRAVAEVAAAESACRKALETGSWLPETELALGKLYVASGRSEQGEAVFRALLVRDPGNADAYIGLASALEAQGRLDDAERNYREATEVEPGYWYAYNRLGTFFVQHGQAAQAAIAFEKVTGLAPGNSSGYNNLGTSRLMTGQLDAAAESFRRSIEIEPAPAAFSNLGTIYFFLHEYGAAAEMFSSAIELASEDFEPRGGRADVLWQMPDRRDDALADYRVAIALAEKFLAVNPSSAVAWAQLGCYYGRSGALERSEQAIQRAVTMAPDDAFVSYYAAISAADRGDHTEAVRWVSKSIAQGYPGSLMEADPVVARYLPRAQSGAGSTQD